MRIFFFAKNSIYFFKKFRGKKFKIEKKISEKKVENWENNFLKNEKNRGKKENKKLKLREIEKKIKSEKIFKNETRSKKFAKWKKSVRNFVDCRAARRGAVDDFSRQQFFFGK